MARRRQGLLEHLIDLPWPVGVGVGILGFVAVRWGLAWYFASAGGQFNAAISKALADGGLNPLAWLLLGVGLIAAVLSYWNADKRRALLDVQSGVESLRELSWAQFEQLVGEAFRRQGYVVEETGQGGPDGGVDLLLRKDGLTHLVQCKQWRARQVGVATVREMFGVLHHTGAASVKIVCTGVFSTDCIGFAMGKPIELMDGAALAALVKGLQVREANATPVSAPSEAPPPCPTCATSLVRRTNRSTGEPFWGCPNYPRCRGTLPFAAAR
jgi:restriction system protein